jgi:hypothetical protein
MAAVVDMKVEFDQAMLDKWKKFSAQLGSEVLLAEADKVHRMTVVQFLRSLILVSPVDTGRLRAAWTPMLQRMGVATRPLIEDQHIAMGVRTGTGARGKRKQIDWNAVQEGMKLGRVKSAPLDTTIINNVRYAGHVEARLRFVQRVSEWGSQRQKENFQAWWASVAARAASGTFGFPDVPVDSGKTIG